MKRIILLLVFLSFNKVCLAQSEDRWTHIVTNDFDNVAWYFDVNTIKEENSVRSVWIKKVFLSDYYFRNNLVEHELQKIKFYCNEDIYIIEDIATYYKDLKSPDVFYNQDLIIEIVPESISERIFNHICQYK